MDQGLKQQVDAVLAALDRAASVFGGHVLPVDPPAFAAPADLEDHLGLGRRR